MLTVIHWEAACDAASVQFGPTIKRTDVLLTVKGGRSTATSLSQSEWVWIWPCGRDVSGGCTLQRLCKAIGQLWVPVRTISFERNDLWVWARYLAWWFILTIGQAVDQGLWSKFTVTGGKHTWYQAACKEYYGQHSGCLTAQQPQPVPVIQSCSADVRCHKISFHFSSSSSL